MKISIVDKAKFFAGVKTEGLFRTLSSAQVKSMEAILDHWNKDECTDIRWLAYIFATVYHETALTMQPINEYGKGKGRTYGTKTKRSGLKYTTPDKIYFGRGFVQLTWYENYQMMGRLLGVPLLNNPELALDLNIATEIMFEGMTKGSSSFGDFTGKCLEMYFNAKTDDPEGARRIINGTDKAEKIAVYHNRFKKVLDKSLIA